MQWFPLSLVRKYPATGLAAFAAMLVAGFLIFAYSPSQSDNLVQGNGIAATPSAGEKTAVPAASKLSTTETGQPDSSSLAASVPGHTPHDWPGKPFAKSLDGTQIDGELRADANGNLIVDLKVKDFFDYFLSAVGEVKPEVAVAEMEKLARASLPPKAVNQAMTLLGQYLDYKEKALNFSRQKLAVPPDKQGMNYQIGMLRKGLKRLSELQNETMPPEAVKAFFGAQQAYGHYVLKSLEIQQRKDLTPSEKAGMIANARNQLPPIIAHTQQQLAENQNQMQQIQHIEDTAASSDEAAVKLEQLGVSQDRINRIVGYMDRKADFAKQYQAYAQDLQRLKDASLAPDDFTQQKNQLLHQYFSDSEERTWAKLKDMTPSPKKNKASL